MKSTVSTRLVDGFDDSSFGVRQWQELLHSGAADHIYLTWQFQRCWWETFGRGQLLLLVAERGGEPVALAPLYTDSGMVFFVGSAFESDYLDFIGDASEPEVLDALLAEARRLSPGFLGFRLFFVCDRTGTGAHLGAAARRLELACFEEHDMRSASLDLAGKPDLARAAVNKRRLLKLERFYRRQGSLEIFHLRNGEEILGYLDRFFEQHVLRWADTDSPSRFAEAEPRELIERFTRLAARTGWLRFTRIVWQGRDIAYHYGYCYRGRFYWGMPSFAPDVPRSPGQLMIRQLLMAAIEEGARVFDFGTGTQPFKLRFATDTEPVRTLGLYPEAPAPGLATETAEVS